MYCVYCIGVWGGRVYFVLVDSKVCVVVVHNVCL